MKDPSAEGLSDLFEIKQLLNKAIRIFAVNTEAMLLQYKTVKYMYKHTYNKSPN